MILEYIFFAGGFIMGAFIVWVLTRPSPQPEPVDLELMVGPKLEEFIKLTDTKNCVRCLKPAKLWSGHVLDNKRQVTAGWCSESCMDSQGFYGHYIKEMGSGKIFPDVKKKTKKSK